MKSQPRVDPVVTELLSGVKANEEAIASSQINALAQVVKNAADNLGPGARENCIELVHSTFKEAHDGIHISRVNVLSLSALQMLTSKLWDLFLQLLLDLPSLWARSYST